MTFSVNINCDILNATVGHANSIGHVVLNNCHCGRPKLPVSSKMVKIKTIYNPLDLFAIEEIN